MAPLHVVHLASLPVVAYQKLFMCCINDARCGPSFLPGLPPQNNDTNACAAAILETSPAPLQVPVARMVHPLARILGFDAADASTTETLVGVCDFASCWAMPLLGTNRSISLSRGSVQPAFRELKRRLALAWPRLGGPQQLPSRAV